jgi:hypothetical protein
MLRLKLNTYWINSLGQWTSSTSDDDEAAWADARGLILATNEVQSLGDWDRYWEGVRGMAVAPAPRLDAPDRFTEYWRHSIAFAAARHYEMLWIVGLRGVRDDAFWKDTDLDGAIDVADAPASSTARGAAEATIIRRQAELVRSTTGDPHPPMTLLLWNELGDLFEAGDLVPAADPDIVWTFANEIRDHVPSTVIADYTPPVDQPIGYYSNLQFTVTGSHLADGEGPWKIADSFKLVDARRPGALALGLLNVGNVREFLLTAATASGMMWDVAGFDVDAAFGALLGRYFGAEHAVALRQTYRRYLDGFWAQRGGDAGLPVERQYFFHDLRMRLATKSICEWIGRGLQDLDHYDDGLYRIDRAGAANENAALITGVWNHSIERWRALLAAEIDPMLERLAPERRSFFRDTSARRRGS